jgi:hypothetical protein
MKRRIDHLTIFVGAFAFAMLCACSDDECDPEDDGPSCEGNTAIYCAVEYSDEHKAGNPYVWHRQNCEDAHLRCSVENDSATCK